MCLLCFLCLLWLLYSASHELAAIGEKRGISLPATRSVVWHNDVSQRPVAVLGTTDHREDAVAASRRDARGMDHLHALFSGAPVGRLFLRPRYNGMDRRAQTGPFAHRTAASLIALLAARSRKCRFDLSAKQSRAVAVRSPANRDRVADLSYFNHEPVAPEMVYAHESCFGE